MFQLPGDLTCSFPDRNSHSICKPDLQDFLRHWIIWTLDNSLYITNPTKCHRVSTECVRGHSVGTRRHSLSTRQTLGRQSVDTLGGHTLWTLGGTRWDWWCRGHIVSSVHCKWSRLEISPESYCPMLYEIPHMAIKVYGRIETHLRSKPPGKCVI